jgi:hypothetical protein
MDLDLWGYRKNQGSANSRDIRRQRRQAAIEAMEYNAPMQGLSGQSFGQQSGQWVTTTQGTQVWVQTVPAPGCGPVVQVLHTPQAAGTNAPVDGQWSGAYFQNAQQQHDQQATAPQQSLPQVQQFQPVQQQFQPAQQQFQPSQQLLQPSQQQGTQAAPQQAQPMTPTVSAAAAGGYAKVGSGNGGWQQPNTEAKQHRSNIQAVE